MSNHKYLVTARKYRPQRFSEVVAQEHVTDTLKNAIRLDRLAHAYLFSGPRGVGKTTAARILAKAINCTTPLEERGDGAEPCRSCDSCQSFEAGRSLNIIEIDAASNNKVEDIRELRETVRIPPQGARRKVYIIDEVHMLSNAAFNALLKTLEEPPPYVLFIFATTEPNKVLPTILSRCQRFDFRRIVVPEITARLRTICEDEGITADDASLMLVARKGDGALRDALSVFDQAVSLCGIDLHYAALSEALGVVDIDLFFAATDHIQARDSAAMLRLTEQVVRAGYDLQEFLTGLAEHLRNLLVARTMPDTSLIEATEAICQRYAAISTRFTEADLLRLLMITDEAENAVKNSTQPRLKLEMALLKMAALTQTVDLRAVLAKLDQLEKHAADGTWPTETAPTSAAPTVQTTQEPPPPAFRATPPSHQVESPTDPPGPRQEAPRQEAPRQEAPPQEAPRQEAPRQEAPPQEAPRQEVALREEQVPPVAEPGRSSAPQPGPPPAEPVGPPAPPDMPGLFGPPALKRKPPQSAHSAHHGDQAAGAEDIAVATMVAPAPAAAPSQMGELEAAWPAFIEEIKTQRIHVGSLLQHTRPLGRDGAVLLVAVPDAFHQRLLANQDAYLLQHIRERADAPCDQIRFVISETPAEEQPQETADAFDPYAYFQRKRDEHPALRALLEHFGGELVW